MPKIRYADMHCDTVSVCFKNSKSFRGYGGQINAEKLKKAGCLVQCFALFTDGENAALDFENYLSLYKDEVLAEKNIIAVNSYGDIVRAEKEKKIAAVLTVENLGFLKDCGGIERLSMLGVKMASLVWNNANRFAFPNLITDDMFAPVLEARESRGLTPLGKEAVYALNRNRIIIDVSHLSDGGVEDVLTLSAQPVVASHSDCNAVTPIFRNLTDGQIKKMADKGGIAGLNFCRDFIGGEDVYETLYRHYSHMLNVGGEDFPAFGSDFDGIPPYPEIDDCLKMQPILRYFRSKGVKAKQLEKLACGNFIRVFKEVVG